MGSIFGRGASKDALSDAVRAGNVELIKAILQKDRSQIDARDSFGSTALHAAVEKGNRRIVELLIQNGANVNAEDNNGRTPIYFAEVRQNGEMEELLRKCGAR